MDTRQSIEIGKNRLEGLFGVPDNASGLIIFAHGSGSSRHSPRNNFVADILQIRGFATLLFDLLSEEEAADRRNVFDIPLLGDRVGQAIAWAAAEPQSVNLPIGLFGASTGQLLPLSLRRLHQPRSARSFRAVAGRIWPVPPCPTSKHRHF